MILKALTKISTSLTNLNQKLNFLNPKIGINFDNNDKRTYLYFGKAEKEPSRNDYVDELGIYNKYPKSEKLYNVELGHEIKKLCFDDFYQRIFYVL